MPCVPKSDAGHRQTDPDDERHNLNEALTTRLLLGRASHDAPRILFRAEIVETMLLGSVRGALHWAAFVAARFASREELVVDVLPECGFFGASGLVGSGREKFRARARG